ncbi:PKD domain-containing protein, partial [Acinetobacter baumannii]
MQPITIRPLPITNFGLPSAVCLPVGTALFTDSSNTPGGTIVKWQWDFGDSGTDSIKNPTHNYTALGSYTVKLTATSNFGCVKDSSKVLSNIY